MKLLLDSGTQLDVSLLASWWRAAAAAAEELMFVFGMVADAFTSLAPDCFEKELIEVVDGIFPLSSFLRLLLSSPPAPPLVEAPAAVPEKPPPTFLKFPSRPLGSFLILISVHQARKKLLHHTGSRAC